MRRKGTSLSLAMRLLSTPMLLKSRITRSEIGRSKITRSKEWDTNLCTASFPQSAVTTSCPRSSKKLHQNFPNQVIIINDQNTFCLHFPHPRLSRRREQPMFSLPLIQSQIFFQEPPRLYVIGIFEYSTFENDHRVNG